MPSPTRQTVVLIAFVAVCLTVGAIGGLATAPAIPTWYATLAKPSFNPPNWVFGPVWTALYILMAIAAWLVWRVSGWQRARTALYLFFLQLTLNSVWSFIFFGFHRIGLALLVIVLLLAAIAVTAWAFRPHSRLAAILLLPYWAWVAFATVLNTALWRLN
jgi:benzodiazapine receptor